MEAESDVQSGLNEGSREENQNGEKEKNKRGIPHLKWAAREIVQRQWIDIAYEQCDSEVRAFAKCAEQQGLKLAFLCRNEKNAANECLKKYTTEENHTILKIRYAKVYPDEVLYWEYK